MTRLSMHACSVAQRPQLMDFLSANAAARLPLMDYLLPGDLAWRLPGVEPEDDLMLVEDADGLAAWAWFEPPTGLEFDCRPDRADDRELLGAVLRWAEARRRELPGAYPRFVDIDSMDRWADEILNPQQEVRTNRRYLTAITLESDASRIEYLSAAGFQATAHHAPRYELELSSPVAAARAPAGASLRSVTAADEARRVALHRDAWLGSSFSIERYRQIRAMPNYDPTLDLVLETADGSFASYCICWYDPTSRIGMFEPVGSHPRWRGRGVGREVILEGLRRLRAQGADVARVYTAGFNMPARALYQSAGFVLKDTARTFMKVIADG